MSEQLVGGHSTSSSSSEHEMQQTAYVLKLPVEVQVEIFQHLPNLKTAAALRLCCRQLSGIYLANEGRITAALRELLVAPFREYYSFLQRLRFPADSVKTPPVLGWPEMTAEACADLDKTPFAVDVLRHLPYIKSADKPNNSTNLDLRCHAVDYTSLDPEYLPLQKSMAKEWAGEWQDYLDPKDDNRLSNIKHVILIADSGFPPDGVVLLLDTLSGKIFERPVGQKHRVRLPVDEYFASRIERVTELRQVFINGFDPWDLDWDEATNDYVVEYDPGPMDSEGKYDPGPMDCEGEPADTDLWLEERKFLIEIHAKWARHLYRKFGWPGNDWKKEECMQAIEECVSRW